MNILVDSIKTKYLKKDQVVIDIETTGVDRVNCYIQAVGVIQANKNDNFIQVWADNKEDEKDLLVFLREIIDEKNLISYNGINFDLPFILARMLAHGISLPIIGGHIDLYKFFVDQRFFIKRSSYALQALEKEAELERFENFEIEADRRFYENFMAKEAGKILVHNRYDLINTEKLLGYMEEVYKSRLVYLANDSSKSNPIYIERAQLNNNIFRIKLTARDNLPLVRYEDEIHLFSTEKTNIYLMVKVFYGQISKDDLGWVHIQVPPFIKDRSAYILPEEILLINHESLFILENVKNLVKKYLDIHLPNQ